MKKGMHLWRCLLFALLIVPIASAQDDWFYNSESLVIDTNFSSFLTIEKKFSSDQVDSVCVNLSFFPRELAGQEIISQKIVPSADHEHNALIFDWKNPHQEKIGFSVFSRVKTTDRHAKITSKNYFPLRSVPEDAGQYLAPSELIDINDLISQLASELVSGEDDLVVAVDVIAEWVTTNIEYDLTTVTAEAALPASWVLKNRAGVCDEMTSLFIAMLRSVGIPARFISGISYTDSPSFESHWGPHGWAEVYFPAYGWVPYDVTYGEYGWIDPSHIVASITDDAARPTAYYSWRAEKGVSVGLDPLNTEVLAILTRDKREPLLEISAFSVHDSVGFGSYTLVGAEVINTKPYYVSSDIFISQTEGVEILSDFKQHVLLFPEQKKTVYWILRVGENFDRDYIYTIPAVVYTIDNATSTATFTSTYNDKVYFFDEVNEQFESLTGEIAKKVNDDLILDCKTSKEEYYTYEEPLVLCELTNAGNTLLKDIPYCYEDRCETTTLGITQKKPFSFVPQDMSAGQRQILVSAGTGQIETQKGVRLMINDVPAVAIADLDYPAEVEYKKNFTISFVVKKISGSEPQDVLLTFGFPENLKTVSLGDLSASIPYDITANGFDIDKKGSEFFIGVEYADKNNKAYSAEKTVMLSFGKLSLGEKIRIFFRDVLNSIKGGLRL